nr:V-type ATP synthase subunit E family protein [Sedimentibacter sp.]
MSIENITQKILSEANSNAENSIKAAETQSLEIINKAKEEASEIIDELAEKANVEIDTIKSRKISAGKMQERKMMLAARQEVVKKSFDIALEKLSTMPEDKYIKYLVGEILNIPNCEGEILLNELDNKNIGEKLVKAVNEKLKAEKVVLSNHTIQTKGGFVLRNGDIEVNNTFEMILGSMKESLTFEVANALFK